MEPMLEALRCSLRKHFFKSLYKDPKGNSLESHSPCTLKSFLSLHAAFWFGPVPFVRVPQKRLYSNFMQFPNHPIEKPFERVPNLPLEKPFEQERAFPFWKALEKPFYLKEHLSSKEKLPYGSFSFVEGARFLGDSRRQIVAETHRNPLRKPQRKEMRNHHISSFLLVCTMLLPFAQWYLNKNLGHAKGDVLLLFLLITWLLHKVPFSDILKRNKWEGFPPPPPVSRCRYWKDELHDVVWLVRAA